MLVLSRKTSERITINIPPSTEDRVIELLICGIYSPRLPLVGAIVRVGIVAPVDCNVWRDELKQGGRVPLTVFDAGEAEEGDEPGVTNGP